MNGNCSVKTAKVIACYPNRAVVSFVQNSACSGCHAASACTIMDRKQREVTVYQDTSDLKVGDLVYLKAAKYAELKAILFSFVFPLVLLLTVAFVAIYALHLGELVAIVISLAAVFLYYLSLMLLRKPMQRSIYFTIEKISNSQQ